MDFEQLAAEYSNMIHSIIGSLHIYKNQDEFYQTGLIALWEVTQKYEEQKGEFSHYAYMFIIGRMLQLLKKEKKYEDGCYSPDDQYWNNLECETRLLEEEDLLSYFHHLTDLQKKWVMLRFYYGLTNRDIAEIENVRLRKVRAWGDLAMKKFVSST